MGEFSPAGALSIRDAATVLDFPVRQKWIAPVRSRTRSRLERNYNPRFAAWHRILFTEVKRLVLTSVTGASSSLEPNSRV